MLQAKADARIVAEIAETEETVGIVLRIAAHVRVAMIVAAQVVPAARRVVRVTAPPVVPVQVVLPKTVAHAPKVPHVAHVQTDLHAAHAATTTTAARAVIILARATGISMIVPACPKVGLCDCSPSHGPWSS